MTKECAWGVCRLCGLEKQLSFEHAPPQAVGNTGPLQFRTLDDEVNQHRSNSKFPRGLGTPTLCRECNTLSGDLYVAAYADWSRQAEQYVNAPKPEDSYVSFTIQPLNVLKLVVVMALAMVADPNTEAAKVKIEIAKHSALREFVLDPRNKSVPEGYGIYSFLTTSPTARFERLITIVDIATNEWYQSLAEIALPPLGHCIVGQKFTPKAIRNKGLCPIDWFSLFDYNELATIPLRLPNLPISTYFPLDYRTQEEVSLSVARQNMVEVIRARFGLH